MFLERLKKKTFLKNASIVFTGSILAQAFGALSPFLITFFYSPSEVGKLTIAVSIIAVASGFFTLRHESLILITKSELLARNLFLTAMTLSLIASISLFILLGIIRLVSPPLVPNFFLLIPFGIFAFCAYTSSREYLFRQSKFSIDAKTNIFRTFLILSLQLLGGAVRPFASSLLFAKILGESLSTYLNLKHLLSIKACFSWNISLKIVRLFWNKTSQILLAKLMQNLSQHGVNYIWAIFLDLKTLGLFHLANKAVQTPSIFIGENLQKVFEQRTLKYSNRLVDQRKLSLKVIYLKFLIGGAIACMIYLGAIYLLPFVLPEKWVAATEFIKIIAPLVVTSIPASSVFTMYKLFGFFKGFNWLEATETVIKAVGVGFFAAKGETSSVVHVYVWAGITLGIFKFLVAYIYSAKLLKKMEKLPSSE